MSGILPREILARAALPRLLYGKFFSFAVCAFSCIALANTPVPDADFESQLRNAVDYANKTMPKMVDSVTRVDHVSAGPGMVMNYYYTFPSVSASEYTAQELMEDLFPGMRKKSCESTHSRYFLDRGVKFVHIYRFNTGLEAVRVPIVLADCAQNSPPSSSNSVDSLSLPDLPERVQIPAGIVEQVDRLSLLLSDGYAKGYPLATKFLDASSDLHGNISIVVFTVEGFGGGNNYSQYIAVFMMSEISGNNKYFSLVDFLPIGGKGWRSIDGLDKVVLNSSVKGELRFLLPMKINMEHDAPNFPTGDGFVTLLLKQGRLTELSAE